MVFNTLTTAKVMSGRREMGGGRVWRERGKERETGRHMETESS